MINVSIYICIHSVLTMAVLELVMLLQCMRHESDKFCLPAGTYSAEVINLIVKDVAFSIRCVWCVALFLDIYVLWLFLT
jgi:hypothetical protein